MSIKFRRADSQSKYWHFERGCADWPESDFVETIDVPGTNHLCQKCVELRAREILGDLIGDRGADVLH